MMKSWHTLACSILIATMLTACGAAQAVESKVKQLDEPDPGYESDVLDSRPADGLDAATQLALGTIMLEETDHALTSNQAEILLPLWQALQGGVTAEDEIKAVLRGIEGAMTEEQVAVIADMELTKERMQSWMEEQGLGPGGGFPGAGGDPDVRATRQAESGGEGMPPGGRMPSGEDMPPEMVTRIAEFQSMSEEERQAMRATAQAGGGLGAGSRPGAGDGTGEVRDTAGQLRFLLRPLIALLEARTG